MKHRKLVFVVFVAVVLSSSARAQQGRDPIPLKDWPVPFEQVRGRVGVAEHSLHPSGSAVPSAPSTFITVVPCRVVDTRNANGPYGGPKLVGGTSRSFLVPNGPCAGIPVAAAYSLNLTVNLPEANDGFLKAYPTGSPQPLIASLNFNANETKGNAAIVPANGSGSIDIFSNVTTHVIIDINGYFTEGVVTNLTAGTGLTGGGTGSLAMAIDTSSAASGQALSYNGTTTTWSNVINGVTAGMGLSGGGTSGSVSLNVNFAGSGSANTAARSDHTHYVRTVFVSPVGTTTQNGTALINALAGITTASATNPYLLKIEPGIYDVGATALRMKPFVDIEGSGEDVTTITRTGDRTLFGSDSAELRFLTVESIGVNSGTTAMENDNVSPTVTHVTLRASGASGVFAIYNLGSLARGRFVSVTASASGANTFSNDAVVNDGSAPTILDSTISASASGTGHATGVVYYGGTPIIINSRISASGGANSRGVLSNAVGGGTITLSAVTISASGAGAAGIDTEQGTIVVSDSTISAFAPVLFISRGLYLDANVQLTVSQVTMDRTTISASHSVDATNASTARFGAVKLEGTVSNTGGATLTCVASYNGSYTALNSTCN